MSTFNQFTNLYQVSKTLRFELKPIGKTAKTFEKWLKQMDMTKDAENLFAKDKNIRDAYLVIKPIMDKMHEQFIEISLSSDEAKKIDFSKYFEIFRDKDKEFPDGFEKRLRGEIGATYQVAGKHFFEKISKCKQFTEKEMDKIKKEPYRCITYAKVLDYLLANVKELAKACDLKEGGLKDYLTLFKNYWGYLDGYNQNRENYYEFEKEASTAIATRIVHENLPTFCSNARRFEKHKKEYLGIYRYLKDSNREIKIKNTQGEEIEGEAITEIVFQIEYFNSCLAQSQIEEYNRIIGNYNFQINLYNQAHREEKNFKKLDEFERLKKQIGCGKKKSLFVALIKDKDCELTAEEEKVEGILTVERLIKKVKETGDRMFYGDCNELEINTVPAFINFLKECDNWDGIYMSSAAVNKISNRYFANWHSIKDKLKGKNACATYDKKREEPIKLRDAVELSGLFAVLDEEQSELFFKESLFKEDETNEYRGVLDKSLTPSKNLINLLCFDIERNIKAFREKAGNIIALDKYKDENNQAGEEDENIKQIKEWFDAATDAMRIVRYFAVRKSKMKGNIPNVTMEQALSNLLYNDDAQWFKWYDLTRNYLTKKPQDDAKDNKLKLNFDKGNLLNGFVDSYSKTDNGTQYGGYIFRKKNRYCNKYEYYLGISKNAKLFRNHLKDSVQESDKSDFERFEYYQMKSTTPYPNEYSKSKIRIQEIINRLTEPHNEEEKKESIIINKTNSKGGVPSSGEFLKRLEDSILFFFVDFCLLNNLPTMICLIHSQGT